MQGGEGMGAGHRPTLWQVPEVCNLLRHLKNVTRNVSLEGTAYPTVTMAVEGRERSPGGIREGCGLFQGRQLGCSWYLLAGECPTLQPG